MAGVIPKKAGPNSVGCENCGEACEDEVILFVHIVEGEETELPFCSAECWQEYFDVLPATELKEKYREEANFIYNQVCPACKARFRKRVYKEVNGG